MDQQQPSCLGSGGGEGCLCRLTSPHVLPSQLLPDAELRGHSRGRVGACHVLFTLMMTSTLVPSSSGLRMNACG